MDTVKNYSSKERRDYIYLKVSEILSRADNMDAGINGVLAVVGEFLEADRVYVFEIEPDPEYASITFEWDSVTAKSHKQDFQHFKFTEYKYKQLFDATNLVCCPDVSLFPEGKAKQLLEAQGLRATIQYGIYNKGVFSGMVGIDDCKKPRPEWDWNQDQLMTLHFIANLFSMYLFKERSLEKQKVAEKTLQDAYRDSNTRLSTFIDGINGGFKISKNELHFPFFYVSKSMAAIQGYTPEELIAIHPTAVGNGHPEDIAKIAGKMLDDYKKTGKYNAKYRVQHKDGRWIWVQDNGKLVTMPNGEQFVYSLIQDIDESERASNVLKTERAMFRDVLTRDAKMIFVTDVTTGQIIENTLFPSCDDIFSGVHPVTPCDYDEHGERYIKAFDVVSIQEGEPCYFTNAEIQKCYDEGIRHIRQELHLRKVDMYFRVDVYISQDPVSNHVISNTVSFDITDEKKKDLEAEEQAKQAEKQKKQIEELTMVNRINSQFIQNMSHEIRTPLNAVLGFSSVLTDPDMSAGLSAEEKKELSNLITINSKLLTDIVDDILSISDLQSGKCRVTISEVDVESICKSCMKSVAHRLPEGVELLYTSDLPSGFKISSDSRRIEQVIINFLTNSTKHTKEGSIEVSTTLNMVPGYLCIAVTDTGKGIPADKAEQIFERFEKLDVFSQGTGLGLSICKLIADMLRGKVWLDTSYTKGGARFVFNLPI